MAFSLEFDISKLMRALDGADEFIADATVRGMHDALDEWKRESVDIAPIDKSTLRRSITTSDIKREGDGYVGEISANATERGRKGRFNYAYYIHEEDAGGKSLRTPGTEKKFLDIPAQKHGDKWMRDIENEIEDEFKARGW
ncbi:HK97 gp10 family phage protein [Neobacillus mesonae]|nr:HK97 gp10 family phage protein [Neobacillus mesonae]